MLTAEKTIHEIVEENRNSIATPYYLIDESRLLKNLKVIERVREQSGAKSVLALKCFSTWAVFDLMRSYLDGTTSSSLYEARLGAEKFGKEVHAYSVAFSDDEIAAVHPYATKFIFNSISQLRRFAPRVAGRPVGLRINPGVSYSEFDLADPARRASRLGVVDMDQMMDVSHLISGAMFHCNCENDDFDKFSSILDHIGKTFGLLLQKLQWVSLGGGIAFTSNGYPVEAFCEKLSQWARTFQLQLYLEPGESAVTQSAFFVTKVLDIVHNEEDIAIVDGATEPHMLDLLVYRTAAKLDSPQKKGCSYIVAGRTCLAGDVFGKFQFADALEVGSIIPFADAGGYTMVKKNWFNGLQMPSVVVRRLDGRMDVGKRFEYKDYVTSLS